MYKTRNFCSLLRRGENEQEFRDGSVFIYAHGSFAAMCSMKVEIQGRITIVEVIYIHILYTRRLYNIQS